jgi:hypothetical protein
MERAQATVEYLLLTMAVIVGGCLLVHYATPVEAVARAVVHAVAARPHRRTPAHRPRSHRPPHPPRHRTRKPCACPLAGTTTSLSSGGSGVTGGFSPAAGR